MDRQGGHSRLQQVNSSTSTKRVKLFECVGEPPQDNDGVERQKITHVWPIDLTELADGSDYDVNACRLPVDSNATIEMGEPGATPVIHAVISCPTSARTGWEIYLSDFGESTTTPSTQLRTSMDSEVMESVLISESTQASDDGALLHLGEQPTTPSPIAQAFLGATAVECIPISATVSNDGACNNEFVIHYEGTRDVAQPLPPSPGMDRDPSATLESSVVLLRQEPMDADASRVIYDALRDSIEQGVHISPEEDTAKPVVSVAIFPKNTTSSRRFVQVSSSLMTTTLSTLTLMPTPSFLTGSTSSGERIQTKRVLGTMFCAAARLRML